MRTLGRRTFLWVFLGSMLLQVAWITAVPPFRAIDEFDHAYRADSVAHGYWAASDTAPDRGRGWVLVVRKSLVEAAQPVCSMYDYTGPDNCNPIERVNENLVTVASGAAAYHPIFYWIIGTPALPFDGSAAVYAMRAVAATLCSGMIALAAYLLTMTASTRWPLVAMLVACTPVLIYSTSIAAPNGIEMAVGLVAWIGLLSLAQPRTRGTEVSLIAWTTVAAIVLVTVRQLGLLWFAMILSTALVVAGWQRSKQLFEERRSWVVASGFAVGAAGVGALWWIRASNNLALSGDVHYPNPVETAALKVPVWVLQSVAAFPTRNEPAPMPVYAAYIIAGTAAMVLGLLAAKGRLRIAILAGAAMSLAVPFAITLATIDEVGTAWQGRYTLPYAVGVLLMIGLALDAKPPSNRLLGPGLLGLALCVALGHIVSVVAVYVSELNRPAMASLDLWPIIPRGAPALLAAAGLLLWGLAIRQCWPTRVKVETADAAAQDFVVAAREDSKGRF